jgi:hypothetical protein
MGQRREEGLGKGQQHERYGAARVAASLTLTKPARLLTPLSSRTTARVWLFAKRLQRGRCAGGRLPTDGVWRESWEGTMRACFAAILLGTLFYSWCASAQELDTRNSRVREAPQMRQLIRVPVTGQRGEATAEGADLSEPLSNSTVDAIDLSEPLSFHPESLMIEDDKSALRDQSRRRVRSDHHRIGHQKKSRLLTVSKPVSLPSISRSCRRCAQPVPILR